MSPRHFLPIVLVVVGTATARADDTTDFFTTAASLDSYFDGAMLDPGADEGVFVVRGQNRTCRRCGRKCCRNQGSCIDWLMPRSNLPLPLMKEMAEERGATLPLPLGASVIWTEMDRFVSVTDVRLGIGGNPPESAERFDVPDATFHASNQVARLDLWTVPFVNIYGIVGFTSTRGALTVNVEDFPLPGAAPITIPLEIQIQGPTAGFGVTGAVGTKDYFLTLDLNKSWTKFDSLNSSLTALVITPRVGKAFTEGWFKGEFHVGAMWQDTAQTIEVVVDDIFVEVDQIEPDPWNFLVGGLWAIDERIHLMLEGGMGGRNYVISGITVRF
jgi:hypothetical protein